MMISGLKSVVHNQNRQQNDLKLFEFGKTYRFENKEVKEKSILSVYMTGLIDGENWQSKPVKSDFYSIKRAILKILTGLGIADIEMKNLESDKRYAYGLELLKNGIQIATCGLIAPKVAKYLDVKNDVFYGEIIMDDIYNRTVSNIQMQLLSRFPAVTRDLAFVLDKNTAYSSLENIGKKIGQPLLTEMTMFDLYENETHVGAGKKSVALRFTFEDPAKTLTEQEIDQKMQALIKGYTEEAGAVLRG